MWSGITFHFSTSGASMPVFLYLMIAFKLSGKWEKEAVLRFRFVYLVRMSNLC